MPSGRIKTRRRAKEAIVELKSLTRWHQVGGNSAYTSEISGSFSGRIAETSLYGKERESAFDLEIGKIKQALSDFPRQVKNAKNWKAKQYKEKKKEVMGN